MAKNIVAAQLSADEMENWKGQDVHDLDGKKLGKLKDVYLDEDNGQPKWGLVGIGLLSTTDYFVPLGEAARMDDGVHIKASKEKVEHSPELSATGHIAEADEHNLMEHYGLLRGKLADSAAKPEPAGADTAEGDGAAPDQMPVPETLAPGVAVSIAREAAKS